MVAIILTMTGTLWPTRLLFAVAAKTNLDVAHGAIVVGVGGDDDVDVLDDAVEGLVQLFHLQLQLQKSAVHLVHHENWPDALGDSLFNQCEVSDENRLKKVHDRVG